MAHLLFNERVWWECEPGHQGHVSPALWQLHDGRHLCCISQHRLTVSILLTVSNSEAVLAKTKLFLPSMLQMKRAQWVLCTGEQTWRHAYLASPARVPQELLHLLLHFATVASRSDLGST